MSCFALANWVFAAKGCGEAGSKFGDRGWRFVTLSHNLIRGAAGGSILNAELCRATGMLPK